MAACVAAGALGAVPAPARATGSTTTPTTAPASTATGPTTTTTTTATTPTATTPTATTPTATTPTATTPTATTPPPARVTPKLFVGGLVRAGHTSATVPGRAVTITGIVTPYVAGQRVLVQAFVGKRLFAQKLLFLRPSKRHVDGGFKLAVSAPRAGTVTVRLRHSRDAKMVGFQRIVRYRVLSEAVRLGSRGPFVQLLQARLAGLHVYIPQTGVFDHGTELALDTYHRLLGWGEGDIAVNAPTVRDLLNGVGSFHVRFPRQGMHAEGDLSDQVLAYVANGAVRYLMPISSGKPSTPTILGSFQVYRKQPGYLPDGMYFSNFFIRGYAIHGYDPAPDYPASHGCMRLPIVDAIFAYNLLSVGDWVDTYYA